MAKISKGMDLLFEFLSSVIVDLREGILTKKQVMELLDRLDDKDIRETIIKILRYEEMIK